MQLVRRLIVLASLVSLSAVVTAQTPGLRIDNTRLSVQPSISGRAIVLEPPLLLFPVSESGEGKDLNGNGSVIIGQSAWHVWDVTTAEATNLGLGRGIPFGSNNSICRVFGSFVFAPASEAIDIVDYNGDGLLNAWVFHAYDTQTGAMTNLGLNVTSRTEAVGDIVVARVEEAVDGLDLNGDGDASDQILHLARVDPVAGLSGLNFTNTKAMPLLTYHQAGLMLVYGREEFQGVDVNGDGDLFDGILWIVDPAEPTPVAKQVIVGGAWVPNADDVLRIRVGEFGIGEDLNGDGDKDDILLIQLDAKSGKVKQLPTQQPFFSYGATWILSVDEGSEPGDLNGDGDSSDEAVPLLFDPQTGRIMNLGLVGQASVVGGNLFLSVDEKMQGATDLNGDGDARDSVLHVGTLGGGDLINLGLAGYVQDTGGIASVFLSEPQQRRDWNGDGDRADSVAFAVDLERGTSRLIQAATITASDAGRVAYLVPELSAGEDLNGDGDEDDFVPHVYDARTGFLASTGLASPCDEWSSTRLRDRHLAFLVSEEEQGSTDLNGDGDVDDMVFHVVTFP